MSLLALITRIISLLCLTFWLVAVIFFIAVTLTILLVGASGKSTHAMMVLLFVYLLFFFFQAEDGIRDLTVTGVQTCALPICAHIPTVHQAAQGARRGELLVVRVGAARDQGLREQLERDVRRKRDVEARVHRDRVLHQVGEHMALAVERRGGRVGHRGDVLESALVMRQGGTDGQRDVGRRTQLQRDGGGAIAVAVPVGSEEHTSELQSQSNLVCRLLLEKKKKESNKE